MNKLQNNYVNQSIDSPRIVCRLGISPVRPDFSIGAYRTIIANYLAANSTPDGLCYIRIDDTNPGIHEETNIAQLTNTICEILGDDNKIDDAKNNIANYNIKNIKAVRQSSRSDKYMSALNYLVRSGMAYKTSEDVFYFDIKKYADKYGNIIDRSYTGCRKPFVDLNEWTEGNLSSRNFALAIGKRALFHIASVVDDAEMGITHVIRGADKIDSQIPQEMLRKSLDLPNITHAYTKMMKKEQNGSSIKYKELIARGYSVEAVRSYILGSLVNNLDNVYTSVESIMTDFSLSKLKPSSDYFDENRLKNIDKNIKKNQD